MDLCATHQRGLPRLLGGGGVGNSDGRGYGLSSQETFFSSSLIGAFDINGFTRRLFHIFVKSILYK